MKDVFLERLHISRTEALGDGYRKACTDAYTKAQDQELDAARGSDTGEGIRPEELSDNGCVNNIVELLEQIPQQQRKRKLQYEP